jgi:site-specific recombinase XerD
MSRVGSRGWLMGRIGRGELKAFFAEMSARPTISAATVAKHYRSIQQLFRYLEDAEAIDRSPFHKMRPPAVPEKLIPVLPPADIRQLLAACKNCCYRVDCWMSACLPVNRNHQHPLERPFASSRGR